MKKKDKKIEEVEEKPITPEQALADFVLRNQSENRHTRRMMGKFIKQKIVGTNKPFIKNETIKRKNTRATVENKEVEKLS